MSTAILFDKIDIAVYSVVGALLLLALLLLIIGYLIFQGAFHRSNVQFKPESKMTDMLMGPNFPEFFYYSAEKRKVFSERKKEVINVTAADGTNLEGYFYKCPMDSDKTVLMVHGYNSSGLIDFSPIATEYLANGYNVLFTNNRACGASGGKYTGFGTLERLDSVLFIYWLTKRYPTGDIFLQGMSLGAATVLMMSDLSLPQNVKAVISDCAFSSLRNEMEYIFAKKAHIPKWPLINIVEFWCRRIAKFNFDTYSPLISVKNAKLPILFIHGDADRFIPASSCAALYDSCLTEKEIYLVENAGHAASFYKNPEAYAEKTLAWLKKHASE